MRLPKISNKFLERMFSVSNEEKILTLMEKLYTELTEFKVETKEGIAKVNHLNQEII